MTAKRYTCAVCGKPGIAEEMIFSRHTGNRFCRAFDACRARRKRGRKSIEAR